MNLCFYHFNFSFCLKVYGLTLLISPLADIIHQAQTQAQAYTSHPATLINLIQPKTKFDFITAQR